MSSHEQLVFGLDIGTRNVVGSVGYKEGKEFIVVAHSVKEHETRAMLDGQIHDIARVGSTIEIIKNDLESQLGEQLKDVCIAAAGRVLKTITTTVEHAFLEETVVAGEHVHTLDLLGIEHAQQVLEEENDTNYKFYCVGYSVVRYFLNDEMFTNLEGHKANRISEEIIVTFLPEDVVDGLYSAVGMAGLSVANMTLEPIAAINVAIPENFRMLNIALVDVGAGTSDISITKDGSIIAYGMIPHAGDELTELIVQQYLVDFNTAEQVKLDSTSKDKVEFKDIMGIPHMVASKEIWELTEPLVDKITKEVAEKIKELNGNKSVSACFVVGGGGKIHGFTEHLATHLDLVKERVALRGEEVLQMVRFEQDVKKDPLLVTPIGICLNYYSQRNNFIMIHFNGERMKLYDNSHLTIVDAALAAGFLNENLFPKRGREINFTFDGKPRIMRGEAGESAVIRVNGKGVSLNTPLEPNSSVTIEPSTAGENAVCTLGMLDEYNTDNIAFFVNKKMITCPRFMEVNGALKMPSYEIKDGDAIETRNFYTVAQIAEFMDVRVEENADIMVNNRLADLSEKVYENFEVEWTEKEPDFKESKAETNKQDTDIQNLDTINEMNQNADEISLDRKKAGQENSGENLKDLTAFGNDKIANLNHLNEKKEKIPQLNNVSAKSYKEKSERTKTANAALPDITKSSQAVDLEELEVPRSLSVVVNGMPVNLEGKPEYVFVDIFDYIKFDLSAGNGRAIVTRVNNEEAMYTQILNSGDQIQVYWKENVR